MNSKSVIEFAVSGMRCVGCESVLEKKLELLSGVFAARADYAAAWLCKFFYHAKTTRILMTISGVLIIFLGMELLKTGLSMSGF